MYGNDEAKIIMCDNGFILEWSKPSLRRLSQDSIAIPVTSGTEIHTTLKKALTAVERYLG